MSNETITCDKCTSTTSETDSKPWFTRFPDENEKQSYCCGCLFDEKDYDTLPVSVDYRLEPEDDGLPLILSASVDLPDDIPSDAPMIEVQFSDYHELNSTPLFDVSVSGIDLYRLNCSNTLGHFTRKLYDYESFGRFPIEHINESLTVTIEVNQKYRQMENICFGGDQEKEYDLSKEQILNQKNPVQSCEECGDSDFGGVYFRSKTFGRYCQSCAEIDTPLTVTIKNIELKRLDPYKLNRDEKLYYDTTLDYVLDFEITYTVDSTIQDYDMIYTTNVLETPLIPWLEGIVTYPQKHSNKQTPAAGPFQRNLQIDKSEMTTQVSVAVGETFSSFDFELHVPENNQLITYEFNCNPHIQDTQLSIIL